MSAPRGQLGTTNLSELFSAYAITLDVYPPKPWRWRADRASSAAGNHALQLAATDLEYEVTRVKSPVLGRDLNPMGRGDGTYYANGGNSAGGSIAIRGAKPALVGEIAYGFGNAVNNRLLTWDEISKWIEKAEMFCPLLIVTCPVYMIGRENPCEGMDTGDLWVFCCECMPKLCPDCEDAGCLPTIGCCHYKLSDWYTYCNIPPLNDPCCIVKRTSSQFQETVCCLRSIGGVPWLRCTYDLYEYTYTAAYYDKCPAADEPGVLKIGEREVFYKYRVGKTYGRDCYTAACRVAMEAMRVWFSSFYAIVTCRKGAVEVLTVEGPKYPPFGPPVYPPPPWE